MISNTQASVEEGGHEDLDGCSPLMHMPPHIF